MGDQEGHHYLPTTLAYDIFSVPHADLCVFWGGVVGRKLKKSLGKNEKKGNRKDQVISQKLQDMHPGMMTLLREGPNCPRLGQEELKTI